MPTRTTLITSLPLLARDVTWSATATTGATTCGPKVDKSSVEFVRINRANLAQELEAELGKLIAGTLPALPR